MRVLSAAILMYHSGLATSSYHDRVVPVQVHEDLPMLDVYFARAHR